MCSSNLSQEASQTFTEARYPKLSKDVPACHNMTIKTILLDKEPSSEPMVVLGFDAKVEVLKEQVPYQFSSLVAEVGGALGLFLGISLLGLPQLLAKLGVWLAGLIK